MLTSSERLKTKSQQHLQSIRKFLNFVYTNLQQKHAKNFYFFPNYTDHNNVENKVFIKAVLRTQHVQIHSLKHLIFIQ